MKYELKRCGANSKNRDYPCKSPAMKNGRCRIHGGKSTGPPKGSKNALKTGRQETILYDTLDREEKDLYHKIDTDAIKQLEDKIRIANIRYRRMMLRINTLKEKQMVLTKVTKESGTGERGDIDKITKESESAQLLIQKIEADLTRIDQQMARWIELKAKLEDKISPDSNQITITVNYADPDEGETDDT